MIEVPSTSPVFTQADVAVGDAYRVGTQSYLKLADLTIVARLSDGAVLPITDPTEVVIAAPNATFELFPA